MKENIFKDTSKFGVLYMNFIGAIYILSYEDYEKTLNIKTESIFDMLDNMLDSMYGYIKDKIFNNLIENSKKPIEQQKKVIDIYNNVIWEIIEEIKTIKGERK